MADIDIKNPGNETAVPTSIAPWLSVGDGSGAVSFYKAAFGAIETYHLEAPDGSVVSKLSVNGAEFWLSGGPPGNINPEISGDPAVRMILTVADPDSLFNQALKAGASEIFPVGEAHGWRLGRLADPFGHHWEIGRQLHK